MDFLQITLFLSLLFCALVAGFLFAFAVVVMPGTGTLNDHDFLQAFKAMDRVIQKGQPLFILVWLGSLVAMVTSATLGFWQLDTAGRTWLVVAAAFHVLGVHLPTAAINVPLNNRLQRQDLDAMTQTALHQARESFERRWVRWNAIRTVVATLTLAPLFVVVLRL